MTEREEPVFPKKIPPAIRQLEATFDITKMASKVIKKNLQDTLIHPSGEVILNNLLDLTRVQGEHLALMSMVEEMRKRGETDENIADIIDACEKRLGKRKKM